MDHKIAGGCSTGSPPCDVHRSPYNRCTNVRKESDMIVKKHQSPGIALTAAVFILCACNEPTVFKLFTTNDLSVDSGIEMETPDVSKCDATMSQNDQAVDTPDAQPEQMSTACLVSSSADDTLPRSRQLMAFACFISAMRAYSSGQMRWAFTAVTFLVRKLSVTINLYHRHPGEARTPNRHPKSG